MPNYIATFHTHLAAMRSARSLKDKAQTVALSPVPRALSSSCGTCVRYTAEDICRELEKCVFRPLPSERIVIRTMPMLAVTVNGKPLHISGAKPRELFALLVDRGERGITSAEGIACLWPDKPNDSSSQSLFRMTYKRLVSALEEAGAGHIVQSGENRRYLRTDQVDCDLYRIQANEENAIKKYSGQYLQEYSWAEDRNGQLYWQYYSKILKDML